MNHIRKIRPSQVRTSRNWTRIDLSLGAATLCGAAVTDKDLTTRSAMAKGGLDWVECPECRRLVLVLKGKGD